MGRVHRELQERFKCARRAADRIGPCETPCDDVLSALHSERANGRRGVRPAQREQRAEIRRFLLAVASYARPPEPESRAGTHLCEVLQVPDLTELILREYDCKRHYLRRGEKAKLRVLALRYGVSEDAIRKANELEGRRVPIGSGRNFLYIPPSERASISNSEGGVIPARITRSELTAKLRQIWEAPDPQAYA